MSEGKHIFITDKLNEPGNISYISGGELFYNVINYIENHYSKYKDGLETGFGNLHLQKGDLVIFAAKPCMGKTSFVLSLLNQFASKKKISVGLFTPCTTEDLIGTKLLAINTGVPVSRIRSGMLRLDHFNEINEGARKIREAPFYLYNEPNCNFEAIKRNAVSMAMDKQIQLLVVDDFDYLQEIVDAEKKHYRMKLTYLLNEFKRLATELQIPIILVMNVQEKRHNVEPSLFDFRRYMVIPNTADKILFLHREKSDIKGQNAKLIIAKNTFGATGEIPIKFIPETEKFFFENKQRK